MRSRRKLMGTVGTIAAISIGGCLDNGSNIEGSEESNGGTDSGNSNTEEENRNIEQLRSKYIEALDNNKAARTNLQDSLDDIDSDNLESAESLREQAYTKFKDGKAAYGTLLQTDLAMEVWDVENEEDLPEVHHNAVEANQKGIDSCLDLAEGLKPNDGEKPSSDTLNEISTALEEGEYTVPPLEEFEQALP